MTWSFNFIRPFKCKQGLCRTCHPDPKIGQIVKGFFMMKFETTIESPRSFDDTVKAIEQKAAEKGFRVLHTHDVAATLAEKGFRRAPLKIIEICNARYASAVLEKNVKVSLMLPCPISVYQQEGKIFVSALLPSRIAEFFPGAGMEPIANEVEKTVLAIIGEATTREITDDPTISAAMRKLRRGWLRKDVPTRLTQLCRRGQNPLRRRPRESETGVHHSMQLPALQLC